MLKMTKYNVSGIFYTLQGEGPHIGLPSIFVRFSGCNLRCQWANSFCDTPYTSWNPEVNMMSIQQVVEAIDALHKKHGTFYIVLTGGEPTIQDLDPLCDILKQKEYILAVETNGTKKIPDQIDFVICSPKMSDSTPTKEPEKTLHEKSRKAIFDNLAAWQKGRKNRDLYLKFVISPGKTNMLEVMSTASKVAAWKEEVFFMPEGSTEEQILTNSVKVAEIAKQYGCCFSPRLHILLWGNTRNT